MKVLIVDDNPDNLVLLHGMLNTRGFDILQAANGMEALDLIFSESPDLIITDILMPKMDGFTLCRVLKGNDEISHIPLVFYTSTYLDKEDEKLGLALGAVRYIRKPIEPMEFLSQIDEVIMQFHKNEMSHTSAYTNIEIERLHQERIAQKLDAKVREVEHMHQWELLMLNGVSDGIIGLDLNGEQTLVNPAAAHLLGYGQNELIGRKFKHTQAEDGRAFREDECPIYVSLTTGKRIFHNEGLFWHKDGSNFLAEFSSSPLEKNGKIIGAVVIFRDISEQKNLEEKLLASKKLFELFMQNIPAKVTIKNHDDRIVYSNDAARKFFKKESLLGLNAYDLLPRVYADKLQAINLKAKEEGFYEGTLEYLDQNEEEFFFHVMTFVISDEDTEKPQTGTIYFDITAQYKDQQELMKLQTMMENAPISIVITDTQGTIEYVNPWFSHLTGYTLEESIGANPRILKSEYHTSKDYVKLWDEISHKHVWSGTFKNIKKNGEVYWESAIIAPVVNDKGDIVNYIGIKIEITEQMHLKEALADKEEIMIAQSRHAAMGEMIGMIAHQWRQPITAIAMGANNIIVDIALDSLTNEGLNEYATDIIDQTQHLSKTIDDFRNFFKPHKEREKTDVCAILDETLSVIGKSLENNNIEVILETDCQTSISIYARELLQVYLNLLKNAKEALIENKVEEGKIIITITEDVDNVIITICDNAGGIEPGIMKQIFDPYFTTKDEKTGTGLGLYMSQTIVNKHLKGKLEVENRSEGACFTITLPKKWGGEIDE